MAAVRATTQWVTVTPLDPPPNSSTSPVLFTPKEDAWTFLGGLEHAAHDPPRLLWDVTPKGSIHPVTTTWYDCMEGVSALHPRPIKPAMWEKACVAYGTAFSYLPPSLHNIAFFTRVVSQAGAQLEFVPEDFKSESLCFEAVMNDPVALQFVPDSMRGMIRADVDARYPRFQPTTTDDSSAHPSPCYAFTDELANLYGLGVVFDSDDEDVMSVVSTDTLVKEQERAEYEVQYPPTMTWSTLHGMQRRASTPCTYTTPALVGRVDTTGYHSHLLLYDRDVMVPTLFRNHMAGSIHIRCTPSPAPHTDEPGEGGADGVERAVATRVLRGMLTVCTVVDAMVKRLGYGTFYSGYPHGLGEVYSYFDMDRFAARVDEPMPINLVTMMVVGLIQYTTCEHVYYVTDRGDTAVQDDVAALLGSGDADGAAADEVSAERNHAWLTVLPSVPDNTVWGPDDVLLLTCDREHVPSVATLRGKVGCRVDVIVMVTGGVA